MNRIFCALLAGLLASPLALAGEPWLAPGDLQLRHDVQMLVDDGVIDVPILAWPIPTSDIAAALDAADQKYGLAATDSEGTGGASGLKLSPSQYAAYLRVRQAVSPRDTGLFGELRAAARPDVLRTFWNEPRDDYEAALGYAGFWGQRFGGRAQIEVVDHPPDGNNLRYDGSYLAGRFGNVIVTTGWQDRWWGPGWNNSLILSNNARPVPAVSIDRAESTPFETKWLSWLGPWKLGVFLGYMDANRGDYDHPLLFGFRAAARPMQGLEVAIERTAMLCGQGRSCTLSDFWRMWTGHDNAGENVNPANEPGDQLAGWSLRWASPVLHYPYALFWQHTGESIDNKIPRPYRAFDVYGAEIWGDLRGGGSWRFDLESANTLCGGTYNGEKVWDCAYNNGIYNGSGYRYKGRVMGSSMDGDGLQYGGRFLLFPTDGSTWNFMLRYSELNRGGYVDNIQNFVAPGPEDWWSFDISYRRPVPRGWIEIGAGVDDEDRKWNNTSAVLPRGTFTWHYGF